MIGRLAKNAQRREGSDDACDDEQRFGSDIEYGDVMRDGVNIQERGAVVWCYWRNETIGQRC